MTTNGFTKGNFENTKHTTFDSFRINPNHYQQ